MSPAAVEISALTMIFRPVRLTLPEPPVKSIGLSPATVMQLVPLLNVKSPLALILKPRPREVSPKVMLFESLTVIFVPLASNLLKSLPGLRSVMFPAEPVPVLVKTEVPETVMGPVWVMAPEEVTFSSERLPVGRTMAAPLEIKRFPPVIDPTKVIPLPLSVDSVGDPIEILAELIVIEPLPVALISPNTPIVSILLVILTAVSNMRLLS